MMKDNRIDVLLDAVQVKDAKVTELLDLILACPCRKAGEGK